MYKVKSPSIELIKKSFSTLLNGFNINNENFSKCKEISFNLSNKIKIIKSSFSEGGGERARYKHVQHNNKLLVSDRLNLLFDNGKYLEIGFCVGYGQSYGNIPKSGCVTAIGKINNRFCLVTASDATVKAGAIYPIQLRKQIRFQSLSMHLHLPIIFLVDSSGGFLPLQARIFPDKDHGGKYFYNEALIQSKGIPVISLVCGSCTAGGAYIPTMSSENGMILNSSHIFLGGPPLVKAATGENMSADELGGADLHSRISGCTDYIFQTETAGLACIRDIISSLPHQSLSMETKEGSVDPLYLSDELDGLLLNYGKAGDDSHSVMMQILSRILDGSRFNEYKSKYGTNLIAGYGRISGFSVGILACHGLLTENDCLKGSNFIQLCGNRKISIISLVHTVEESSFPRISSEVDIDGSVVKAKSLMMRSMATRNCKMITVVIGDAVGLDYICLGGRSMKPDFLFAWPNSRFGWTKEDLENEELSGAAKAGGEMTVDEIIEPNETRSILTSFLEVLNTKSNLLKQAPFQPIYRF